jgi:hypothetical protein
MNSLIPTYEKGTTATLYLTSKAEGALSDIVVQKVEIFDGKNNLIKTIEGTEVSNISTGVYIAKFIVPMTWADGSYYDKWTVLARGVSATYDGEFFVKAPIWQFSNKDLDNHDFKFILLTKNFQLGCTEYIRILVKEIYDKVFIVDSAQASLIYYKSQYNISQGSWCDMVFDNGVLNYLLNTSGMEKGNKWYVQVKITLNNGETILSPLLNINIL